MLINVTSTDQTIDIFISDGATSIIVGDRGIGSPKPGGGGGGGGEMVSHKNFQF